MATQNQGNLNVVTRNDAYDNATYLNRASLALTANTAGSASTSGKFLAWTALIVYGATFFTTTAGTSTYTVNGTATSPATGVYALFVTNTATGSVALATTTLGAAATPWAVIGGTSTTGTNVNVGGIGGGVAGGFSGPYALNTLGGTSTSQVWGTATYSAGYPGGNAAGQGGLYMNPGDTLQFVNGTDATAVVQAVVQYSIAPLSPVLA
jgi:hypothetical protein